jgi:hypothetical protein
MKSVAVVLSLLLCALVHQAPAFAPIVVHHNNNQQRQSHYTIHQSQHRAVSSLVSPIKSYDRLGLAAIPNEVADAVVVAATAADGAVNVEPVADSRRERFRKALRKVWRFPYVQYQRVKLTISNIKVDNVEMFKVVAEDVLSKVSSPAELQVNGAAAAAAATTSLVDESLQVPVAEAVAVASDRWAVSASTVDLSGGWECVVTNDFKKQFDKYLSMLGQPGLVRSVALSVIAMTTEEIVQSDNGRSLMVRGRNARGIWERTLVASGATETEKDFTPIHAPMKSADNEHVHSESWWENDGSKHRSWIRGVNKYGGGAFESVRYIDENDQLICESTFHPTDSKKEKAKITWTFKRMGA